MYSCKPRIDKNICKWIGWITYWVILAFCLIIYASSSFSEEQEVTKDVKDVKEKSVAAAVKKSNQEIFNAAIEAIDENPKVKEQKMGEDVGSPEKKAEKSADEVTNEVGIEDIVASQTEYRFAGEDKPDPFIPPMMEMAVAVVEQKAPEKKVVAEMEIAIVSPLQKFALAQLSVVGIWRTLANERKALIMTPAEGGGDQENFGFFQERSPLLSPKKATNAENGIIVKQNDPIGNRGGKIVSIEDRSIKVREYSLLPDGTRQYEDSEMLLGSNKIEKLTDKITLTPPPELMRKAELEKRQKEEEERKNQEEKKKKQEEKDKKFNREKGPVIVPMPVGQAQYPNQPFTVTNEIK